MDDTFKTSQQAAGEHSDPGGKNDGEKGGSFPYGTEDQPSGVSVSRTGEEQLQTSQQIRGEHKKFDTTCC